MNETEEIKYRLDLVDFISQYLTLKKAGSNWKALCPFHQEKTPSFMVSRDKGIWRCFGCFLSGTKIKTKDGYKDIAQIKRNDLVVTHKGKHKPVAFTMKRNYRGNIIELRVRKTSETTCLTEDHKLYVIKIKNCKQQGRLTRICQWNCKQNCPTKFFKNYRVEKTEAKNLKIDDLLLYPINAEIEKIDSINLSDYDNHKKTNVGKKIAGFPLTHTLDEDFLKIIGYWIAEGSNHRAYIRFSLGNHEESFAKEIIDLIKKVFKIQPSIHRRKGKKTGIEITACNTRLANIFGNLCGKGAENKKIPFIFQKLHPRKQKIILNAIFKGDGTTGKVAKCKKARYFRSITTVSSLLAEQIKDILLRLNIAPTITIRNKYIGENNVNHKKSFTIDWQEKLTANYSHFYQSEEGINYWLLPIKSRKIKKYKGKVYNLTIPVDHSYIANSFAVGNCGEGGDIFDFVMKMEGLDFREALELLAGRAGIALPSRGKIFSGEQFYEAEQAPSLKTKLFQINALAARLWQKILVEHPAGQKGRDYLKKRNLDKKAQELFGLGYAPEKWTLALDFLKKKGFRENEIAASGLLIKKEAGGYYDRFRGRLIFPIADIMSRTVAFTGRLIEDKGSPADEAPKYINSADSLIYNKSRLLYGLDKAKTAIKKADRVIVVEGNMDVIRSQTNDFLNTVASSGTALTADHLVVLSRFTANILIAFDADRAGQLATERIIELALGTQTDLKIVRIPDGFKDADEVILKSPPLWRQAIENALPVIEYYFEQTFREYKGEQGETKGNKGEIKEMDVGAKKKISRKLLPLLVRLPDPIERAHYLQLLAKKLVVPEKSLEDAISKLKTQSASRRTNVKTRKPERARITKKLSPEETLLGLLSSHPEYQKKYPHLYKELKEGYNKNIDALIFAVEEIYRGESKEEIRTEIEASIRHFKDKDREKLKEDFANRIKTAEEQGNRKEVQRLILELQKLI